MNNITSTSNPIIKEIKSLHKKKYRNEYKKYFVEGIRSVEEAIRYNSKVEYIVYSESLLNLNGGSKLYEDILKLDINIIKTTDQVLKTISDTDNPQGIIAVVNMQDSSLEDLVDDNKRFFIVLDRIQDPGNMGTIIRTCDAFNVDGVIISEGSVDLYNPKTIRSTMGSIFHIPIILSENILETIDYLRTNNIIIMSTALENSKDVYSVDLNKDIAIIIGNEANGVREELLNVSDANIKIPMGGKAESLNAAIASSIVIYEANRQRQKI